MIQALNVRDFPENLRRQLKSVAALQGVSLRELIIRYCKEGLERDKKGKKRPG